jgi:hypothetical protein
MEKLDILSTSIDKAFNTEPTNEKKIWLTDEHRYITEIEYKQRINDIETERLENHKTNRLKYKIDVNEVLQPPQVAWSLLNTKSEGEAILGTLGDFGLIIGKAKSRKSFFINIAVSTALSKDLIFNRFKSYLPPDKNEVIYFDTEQSKYYVHKAVKRICKQINEPEPQNLNAYHLRSLKPSERLIFIENEIYSNDKIGFVVIDGIKDLITSINDEGEATMIASKLLKWSEERNIYILTVLHQNKSDTNARGHIGTELINKAQTVLSITKAENNENISIVEPQQCRDKEPEVFAFEIDEYGLPILAENFEIRTEKPAKIDVTEINFNAKQTILSEVYSKGDEFCYSELIIQIGLAYKFVFNQNIGINKRKELITDFKNLNLITQDKTKAPYKLTTLQSDNVIF